MTAYIYVIADSEKHVVGAAEGELSKTIAKLDKALGKPAMLLWAEAVRDIETANCLIPLIEALDDDRYAALLAGEDEAMSLLREGPLEIEFDDEDEVDGQGSAET